MMAEGRAREPLSDRELELLSAYLDDELSERERAQLEQRLHTDAVLQAELEVLRQLVVMVGELPEVAPPRNFTLDPAQYSRAPAPFWTRLATPMMAAGASLVLVGICVGAFVLRGGLAATAGAPALRDAQSVAEEAAPAEQEAPAAEAQPPEEFFAAEEGAAADEAIEEEDALAQSVPTGEEAVPEEAPDAALVVPPAAPEPEQGIGGGADAEAEELPLVEEEPAEEASEAEGEPLAEGEAAAEAEEEALPAEEPSVDTGQEGITARSTTELAGTPTPLPTEAALGQTIAPTEIAEQAEAEDRSDDDTTLREETESPPTPAPTQPPLFLIGLAIGGAIVLGVLLIVTGASIALAARRS